MAGVAPEEMGIGPVKAIPRLLRRAGLRPDAIDLWEINEAFAGHLRLEGHRPKPRWGVVSMCVGSGQGAAGLFEIY